MAWKLVNPNITNDPSYLDPRLSDDESKISSNTTSLAESTSQLEILNKTSVSILTYGADTSKSAVDNTTAIQNAVNAMVSGSTLVIPFGTFNVNNLTFNLPDDCTLLCYGTLVNNTSGAGIAITVGSSSKVTNRLNIQGLKIKSLVRDWTTGRTGIKFINIYSSYIDIRNVYGFQRNIDFNGSTNQGSAYNEVHLGENGNSQQALYLSVDNGGWCNENKFYGGHFYITSDITEMNTATLLTVSYDSTHQLNNNHFYSPSLEVGLTTAKGAKIEGSDICIYSPRLEAGDGSQTWTNAIEITSNGNNVSVFFGYGVSSSAVLDNGIGTKLFLKDGLVINSSNTTPTIKVKNQNSASNKIVSFSDTAGTETFYVKGTGELFSNQFGTFGTGIRYSSGRGFYNGAGSPETVVTSSAGGMYVNTSGGTGTSLYVKETGAGNAVGWIPYQPIKSGTTTNRPATTGLPIGYGYFDTSLNSGAGMEVRWNGTNWINPSTGTTV